MNPLHSRQSVLMLLLTLISRSSNAFIASRAFSSTVRCCQQQQPGGFRNRPFMKKSEHSATTTSGASPTMTKAPLSASASCSSRRSFIRRGALATTWAFVTASITPLASEASQQFAGVEIRGIDVAEVLHPGAGGTGKASKPLRDCLLNVERVRISTKQLEDTLTKDGAPPGLTSLVKGLVKNYKLDESLQQGALYIESQMDRNAAASAGREALEYLAQTVEYFPVELDERTGAPKKPSAEALEFTVNALDATRGKLDFYLTKVPSDALQEARAEIAAESGDS